MQKNKLLFVVLLCLSSWVKAQNPFSKELEGRIVSKSGDVAATHVQNKTTKRATITDVHGYFVIRAKVQDTLIFSAVQFKKKEIVVSTDMLQSLLLKIPMEDALTELDEVVVTPYNLSGDISKDLNTLETEPVVTASTLGLPNAYVKPISKAERKLFEATTGRGIPLNPIINGISGRTKMLKNRIKRNKKYERTQRVRAFYVDSLFIKDLKIPIAKIEDFMYFCEIDTTFQTIVDSHDHLKIWEYLRKKSTLYRTNNAIK
ncbi:carboxypeptidase-like regulatory domain-containing protein [uncultured Maribacter sp.]|uniref:carboxypeptidase-like regulatory domain-containing protein n=1 Tax=uncultured Maribacter sp. TaxID=431308 RepID=UPI002625A0C4|nr:carboxypeptidase-like regulatory domain-containing protein [uncultured Maribacter sp.]